MEKGHASGRKCTEEREGPVEEGGDQEKADDRPDIADSRADP